MTMLLVEKYGSDNVYAVSYDYGQKQKEELNRASKLCNQLGIGHKILDLTILGELVRPVCANIGGTDVAMPTIQDVLGDPQPPTEVPYRNMILLSLTLAYAQVIKASHVSTGLQIHDCYSYWDNGGDFVDKINDLSALNRKYQIRVIAPFSALSKTEELEICKSLDQWDFLQHTLTCYEPVVVDGDESEVLSCGKCPSCAERIRAFINVGIPDPIKYIIDIPWKEV